MNKKSKHHQGDVFLNLRMFYLFAPHFFPNHKQKRTGLSCSFLFSERVNGGIKKLKVSLDFH